MTSNSAQIAIALFAFFPPIIVAWLAGTGSFGLRNRIAKDLKILNELPNGRPKNELMSSVETQVSTLAKQNMKRGKDWKGDLAGFALMLLGAALISLSLWQAWDVAPVISVLGSAYLALGCATVVASRLGYRTG